MLQIEVAKNMHSTQSATFSKRELQTNPKLLFHTNQTDFFSAKNKYCAESNLEYINFKKYTQYV